ncbi:MAG: hypothetical protein A2V66_09995 [Ignavibacteria bacterium RBG_13_36_8]|nr:MAG: hypothetical protein A2V66_09995 [Ignavibacteria bacterium RBG_13_36_8]
MFGEIQRIAEFIINGIIHIWPYLVITIPIAVAVKVSGASKYINKALRKRPVTAIFLATIVGAFSPFCSCGVIPVIASLLIGGVPLAPVMSFWLASPSMDPEIFFLSVSVIGWELAVWRLAATFVMSLSAGFVTHLFVNKGWLGSNILRTGSVSPVKSTVALIKNFVLDLKEKLSPANAMAAIAEIPIQVPAKGCGCSGNSSTTANENASSSKGEANPVIFEKLPFRKISLKESVNATVMVAKFMILAFFLEALIIFYIPSEVIIDLLGKNNPFAILTAALVGIPVYTSSIPALAMMGGLLAQGMAPAAALAFLIAGPTTTIPAMAAVWNIASRRVFVLYVMFTLVSAVVMGYLYQFISML